MGGADREGRGSERGRQGQAGAATGGVLCFEGGREVGKEVVQGCTGYWVDWETPLRVLESK